MQSRFYLLSFSRIEISLPFLSFMCTAVASVTPRVTFSHIFSPWNFHLLSLSLSCSLSLSIYIFFFPFFLSFLPFFLLIKEKKRGRGMEAGREGKSESEGKGQALR